MEDSGSHTVSHSAPDNDAPEDNSHQNEAFPDEPELRNVFENSPDVYDEPIDTVLNTTQGKWERSATPDDHHRQSPITHKRRKAVHKTDAQDAGGMPTLLDPPLQSTAAKLELERAMFERRRKAVADCHDAVKAMAQAMNALVKKTVAQVHEVTKHVSVRNYYRRDMSTDVTIQDSMPLFAMLPEPHSKAFSIMAVSFKPGFELEKVRWHYEILYSVEAPSESALERLTQAQFHLKNEIEKPSARVNATKTTKSLSAKEKRHATIFKDLLRRIGNAVRILDRLSEKIGKDRFEVDKGLLRRFDAANKNGKTQIVNKAWQAAQDKWGKPGFRETAQGKQVRMLRILRRYHTLEPILDVWNKMLKARTELRECCSQ